MNKWIQFIVVVLSIECTVSILICHYIAMIYTLERVYIERSIMDMLLQELIIVHTTFAFRFSKFNNSIKTTYKSIFNLLLIYGN